MLSEAPQTVAIEDDPFDSKMSETTRMAYGQSASDGSTAVQSTLRQSAVPNLAAARSAQECDFADREGREIVMQHEALFGFAFEGLQTLHVFASAQRGRDQRLGLTAGKDGRAVSARQHSDFNPDIANLVELAPVGTAPVLDHLLTEDLLAQKIEVFAGLLASSFVFFGNGALDFVFELLDERVALVLGMLLGVDRIQQTVAELGTKLAQIGLVGHDRLDLPLRLANFLGQVADRGANLLDLLMAEFDGLHHGFFRNLLGAGLDHDNAVRGADHHQVQLAASAAHRRWD